MFLHLVSQFPVPSLVFWSGTLNRLTDMPHCVALPLGFFFKKNNNIHKMSCFCYLLDEEFHFVF